VNDFLGQPLAGRVYLVTGAASGIGRAAALAIADVGGALVLGDVNVEGGEATVKQIRDKGRQAFFLPTDVSKAAEIDALAEAALDHFGGLDGAFNNAGIGGPMGKLHMLDEAVWDQVIAVNLKSVWLCLKAEIPRLRNGKGAIVNMASAAGVVALPNHVSYTASKHGVVGLSKVAALEYARQGVRVNVVCPGFVDTPLVASMNDVRPGIVEGVTQANPMRRLGDPSEVANAVVWLLSDASSFVNGHAMVIDGGFTAS
jgi:NAD(P)-dependent dehydrogenase (short-subunit alcohol dehydrogenase family)